MVAGTVRDTTGDHGLEGPTYSDLAEIAIESVGARARVTIRVAATLPARPEEGEVIGIGLDLYYGVSDESDYQLFADGSADGWFAYLHGPRGIVDYPGRFFVIRNRVVFEVPWSALGDKRSGRFRSFLDWSKERAVLNAVAQDRAPNGGQSTYRR